MKRLWAWLLIWFRWERPVVVPPLLVAEPEPAPLPPPEPEPAPEKTEPRKRRISKRRTSVSDETLSDLLDNIENAFDNVTAPIAECEIDSDLRIGLKRLGPYVIDVSIAAVEKAANHIVLNDKPSALIFIHFKNEKDGLPQSIDREQFAMARFFFANKMKSFPAEVSKPADWHDYHLYECGIGWKLLTQTKLAWTHYYACIHKQHGGILIAQQLCHQKVLIKPINQHYTKRLWTVPLAWGQSWGEDALARWTVLGMSRWDQKASMWSVSVRHRGLRATFCVDNNNAVPYFRDREKTALTDGGRRRPIIHICDEHQREIAPGKFTTVKQHIRGLRTFDWRGYECAITAPTFHAFFINQFDVESEEFELDKLQPGLISASKFAGLLAQYEDTQSTAAADAQLKEKQE